jgi:choline dehydrogenase-like flavoprotein
VDVPFSAASSSPSPILVGIRILLDVPTPFNMTPAGPVFSRSATVEVILAAGAVNTPQLLMLSGIGDKAQLSQFNIQTIVNLPDVGRNMQDHVLLLNVFSVNSNFTNDDIAETRRYSKMIWHSGSNPTRAVYRFWMG